MIRYQNTGVGTSCPTVVIFKSTESIVLIDRPIMQGDRLGSSDARAFRLADILRDK